MRPNSLRAAAVIAVFHLLALPMRAHADLLVNGNFEDGPVIDPGNPIFGVAPGSNVLTGWDVSGAVVCIVTDNYWVPLSGHRSLCLSDNRPLSGVTTEGTISQSFASAPGAIYRLTFWLSGEPFSTPTLKHLHVSAGATAQDYVFDTTPAWHWDMAWAQHTLDFAAPGSVTTVALSGKDASQWGPALDSMSVELVSAGVPTARALAFAAVSPDPVRTSGRLAFTLPAAARARLAVYDVQGREAAELADGQLAAGPHAFEFSPAAWGARPGLYLAVLRVGQRTLVRRFTVLE